MELTQSVWEPEHGVTREEQCALAGVVTLSAPDLVVTFAHPTICLTIQVRLAICGSAVGSPRSTATALAVTTGLQRRVLCIRTQALETCCDEALCRLLARTVCFEGTSDGRTTLGICVRPHCETDTVIGDCAAGCVRCVRVSARSELIDGECRTMSLREDTWRTKERSGPRRLREGIVIGKKRCSIGSGSIGRCRR